MSEPFAADEGTATPIKSAWPSHEVMRGQVMKSRCINAMNQLMD